jgi:hypothetical protein
MARRLGAVDLTPEQLLEAVALLNCIEHATADIARDRPELDAFVGDVRLWLREVRQLYGTPQTVTQAQALRRLLDEVARIDQRVAAA